MENLTLNEKVHLASWMISFKSPVIVTEKFREMFNKKPPGTSSLYFIKNLFLETGSVVKHRPRSGRPISASGDDVVDQVREKIANNPSTSIRKLVNDVGISYGSVSNILHKKIHAHPYKAIYSQELHDGDEDRRLQFCQIMKHNLENDPAYLRKLTFSDECNFHLNGTVNKHNLHYWSTENPHIRHATKSATSRALTVWAIVSCRGLINWHIQEETMNADRYMENVILPIVVPFFITGSGRTMVFQQDGASPDYQIDVCNVLDQHLRNRWIGRRGPIEWPARSPDLTVCDFFLWSYLRDRIYTPGHNFQHLVDLRLRITDEIQHIDLAHLTHAFQSWVKRINLCIDANGGHLEE